jgi:hypothetical protein
MLLKLICTYCGYTWLRQAYSKDVVNSLVCAKCNDKNIIAKDAESKIDYYQGCPPFPIKAKEPDPQDDTFDELYKYTY